MLKIECEDDDPLAFLLKVMKCKTAPADLRVRAAITATQYTHVRTRDGGKNIVKSDQAKAAATGKYAPGTPPLRVVGNK